MQIIPINSKKRPRRGELINNDSQLIIGCSDGCLLKYDLENPTTPIFIENIYLHSLITSFLSLNQQFIMCGQKSGEIDVVNLEKFESVSYH